MAGLVLASPNSVSVPIELTEEAFYMRPFWLGLGFALILGGLIFRLPHRHRPSFARPGTARPMTFLEWNVELALEAV